MTLPASSAPPLELADPSRTAFFLDFDGTLVEIAAHPGAVRVAPDVREHLRWLSRSTGGATAVVSGRSIDQIDEHLHPLRLPVAGVHGLERRDIDGHLVRTDVDAIHVERLQAEVAEFAAGREGLFAEQKRGTVALHYRMRPELEEECLGLARRLTERDPLVRTLRGKMVVELKLGGRSKGDAIADFMKEPPFRGRKPFFVGDDLTDEAGFEFVTGHDGIAVKVGPGETAARYRMAGVAGLAAWFDALRREWEGTNEK
jgi:trehalose 6-phosphate phosphatase